jgi:hypothetical protein
MYNLGLDLDPNMNTVEKEKRNVKFLVIGGSHAKREGQVLVERGFEVLTCAVGGWRPNKTAGEEMAVQVEAALQHLMEDDIIVVHCFDNVAYMARSEEGGGPTYQEVSQWRISCGGRLGSGRESSPSYVF